MFIQLRHGKCARIADIADQKQCVRPHKIENFLAFHKNIGKGLVLFDAVKAGADIFIVIFHGNFGIHAAIAAQRRKPDAGAERIMIRMGMPHDQHIFGFRNQGNQLRCDHAGAHLCPLLQRFGASAAIFDIVARFINGLVAPAL